MKERVQRYLVELERVGSLLSREEGKRDLLLKNLTSLEKREEELLKEVDIVSKAKDLLEMFVRSTEVRVREYIEPVVTEALNFVFSQNLYFHIVFAPCSREIFSCLIRHQVGY